MRRGSPTKLRVTSGARSMHSSSPFSSTWPMSRSLMSSSSIGSSKFNCSMLSLPASMREKSRMSLMMPSKWSAARRILLMCCCLDGIERGSRHRSDSPRMALSGVRTSCDMLDRNLLLARLAASACCMARRRSWVCSSTMRARLSRCSRSSSAVSCSLPLVVPQGLFARLKGGDVGRDDHCTLQFPGLAVQQAGMHKVRHATAAAAARVAPAAWRK